ncbi:MAG: hypothetical protein FWG66_13290 [Spirochaetes bacterium]|nr:hypothetical protein [Spirochaetota bacterium]
MKNKIALAASLTMLVTVATTSYAQSPADAPGFVQSFLQTAPGNVFVGVGYATGHNAEVARANSALAATANLIYGIEEWIAASLAANGRGELARNFSQRMAAISESELFSRANPPNTSQAADHAWNFWHEDWVEEVSSAEESISKRAVFSHPQPGGSQVINHVWDIYTRWNALGTDETEVFVYTVVANGNTTIALQGTDAGGAVWTVVFMNRADVVMESDTVEDLGNGPPLPVENFLLSVPSDELSAVGVARMSNSRLSTAVAEHRARVGIAIALETRLQNIFREFFAVDEAMPDTEAIKRTSITTATSEADVSDARVVFQHIEPDGTIWAVVVLDRY